MTTQIGPPSDWVHKFGFNDDLDASNFHPEDLVAVDGRQYWPAGEVQASNINVFSDDANDTAAGIGARTIVIEGLDGNYLEQSETIIMNGLTSVHPTLNYLRIHRAYVTTAGVNYMGNNMGNITIADGSGVFAYILAGKGQTLQAAYTVPDEYNFGVIWRWEWALVTNTRAWVLGQLMFRPENGAWRVLNVGGASDSYPHRMQPMAPSIVPARSDIVITMVRANAANLTVSGWFDIELRKQG